MSKRSRQIFRFLRVSAALSALMVAVSCDAPVKMPAPPQQPQVESPPPAPTPPPVAAAPTLPAVSPPVQAPAPEPAIPEGPILEVREEGKKITISGWISSQFQAADIVKGITYSFPEGEIVNELQTDSRIPEVRWGNRVMDLILPLLGNVEDARFYYKDGVTHLEGTVKEAGMITQFQTFTTNVMSDSDARDIENRLKTADGTTINSKPKKR